MSTISRWIGQCYISTENLKTDPIRFDFTDHAKTFLRNEVWKRKFSYGFPLGLENTNISDIENCSVTIHPRFYSGIVNEKRLQSIVSSLCGVIPNYFDVPGYKRWRHQNGIVVIEASYKSDLTIIPTKKDLTRKPIPVWNMQFVEKKEHLLALLEEIAALFLAALKLSFPTEEPVVSSRQLDSNGIYQIISSESSYFDSVPLNGFLHPLLIEPSKMTNVENNITAIASVWHFNLWPVKRYLTAVDNLPISMDNLLDLTYALEGLFEKQATSDFIKIMCVACLCSSRIEANKTRDFLNVVYGLRNDIAHGERSYAMFDKIKVGGQERLGQMIYWEMKAIVAKMILHAFRKLLSAENGQTNLRFNVDDLHIRIFESPRQ